MSHDARKKRNSMKSIPQCRQRSSLQGQKEKASRADNNDDSSYDMYVEDTISHKTLNFR